MAAAARLGVITPPRPETVNYDETKVPPYSLPEALTCFDGTPVTSAQIWHEKRRPELLSVFAKEIYGRAPERCPVTIVSRETDPKALAGLATLHQLEVRIVAPPLAAGTRELTFRVALWLPNAGRGSVPAFIGLNYFGNQSVHSDPSLQLAKGWVPNREEYGIRQHVATEASRGCQSERWPLELIVARGYAVATVYAGDFDPDYDDGFQNGVHGLFLAAGERPLDDEWAAISAWAWGMSHMLDVLALEPRVDVGRVVATGHSRFAKAALWAGANDPRFAIAISNDSGCGGASLSRRRFGELTSDLNRRFPHWFCQNFRRYDNREDALPVDQHELLALLAPRPVYVASAELDLWADPKGEYLACAHADPVFRLCGRGGFGAELPPIVGQSLGDTIGYHVRAGTHNITQVDWWHYLAFADRHLTVAPGGP
jgi:hypothetical protein